MITRAGRLIVLAGIGGDSHSVGLITLHRALIASGFGVLYLSTQNQFDEVCRRVRESNADALLVSNMDGHASHYLDQTGGPDGLLGTHDCLCYLGGNPSLDVGPEAERRLAVYGFDRVFAGYVEPAVVVRWLDEDFRSMPRLMRDPTASLSQPQRSRSTELVGRYVSRGRPLDARDEVLRQWPTGREARSLERNAETCFKQQDLADTQHEARARGRMLLQPRVGVSDPKKLLGLFQGLRAGGADVLSFQIDSLTRNNNYAEVARLAGSNQFADTSELLNGFPMVNHGVARTRSIVRQFPTLPFQVRHSTRDPRLLAEISFASGITAFEGGALTYNLPYYRDYEPSEALQCWQYVDELAGVYARQFDITIDREFFGVLTATLTPPSMAIACCILEALLAAAAGVRSVSLGYAEQGNRTQDVAAIRAMEALAHHYLDAHGELEVAVSTVFHQYMAAFPEDQSKALQMLEASTMTAKLSGAHRIMLKTTGEARSIPREADNLVSLATATDVLRSCPLAAVDEDLIAVEEDLIVQEARAILDAVLAIPKTDLPEQIATAVQGGVIDVPYSPSVWNAGRVVPIRDVTGAVRFGDVGRLPLPASVIQFHAERCQERLRRDSEDLASLVERDVLRTARGAFESWPLCD